LNDLDKPAPLLLNGSDHNYEWPNNDILGFTTFVHSWQDKIDGKIAAIVHHPSRVIPIIKIFSLLKDVRCGIFCGQTAIPNAIAFLKRAEELTVPGNVYTNICEQCPHDDKCVCKNKFMECGNKDCVLINCLYKDCLRG
jgi:hypothetical protein